MHRPRIVLTDRLSSSVEVTFAPASGTGPGRRGFCSCPVQRRSLTRVRDAQALAHLPRRAAFHGAQHDHGPLAWRKPLNGLSRQAGQLAEQESAFGDAVMVCGGPELADGGPRWP